MATWRLTAERGWVEKCAYFGIQNPNRVTAGVFSLSENFDVIDLLVCNVLTSIYVIADLPRRRIGGEIMIHHLTEQGFEIYPLGEFEDFETNQKAI